MKYIIVFFIAAISTFATFAQTAKSKPSSTQIKDTLQAKYVCTMDTDVVSNKPGKCPKCGMDLVKAKTYTCSMHPEVVSDKPGKCPKCDMELVELKDKPAAKKD